MPHDDAISIGGRMGWNKLGSKVEAGGDGTLQKEELKLCASCKELFKQWKIRGGKPPQACAKCADLLKGRYGI